MAASRQFAASPLAELLIRRIRAEGPISFADYMRECLYHPSYGYYSRAEVRRFSDYYTSVDVHPIFGRLLARQLEEMWRVLARPKPFCLVEAGAGTGRLALNILDFAESKFPDFYNALCYVAVERGAARRSMHLDILARHLNAGICESAAELPPRIPAGCVLSNELIDALPVHRVVASDGALHEILVGIDSGTPSIDGHVLCEQQGPLTSSAIPEYFAAQGMALAEGQQAEAGLEACDWIVEVARRLDRGFVLTIDYGHEAAQLYSEAHFRGTLLAYRAHGASEDFCAAPGEQDLTAHANFTALDEWGQRAGLIRTGLVSQSRFLMALGKANQFGDLYHEDRGKRDGSDGKDAAEEIRARLLLKNLIFPEAMGEIFKVLVQHKGIAEPVLTGLSPF